MITRPVYIPTDSPPYFTREDYQIPYGTPEQMIAALHQAFQQRHPGAKVLEISSKSDRPEGKALSAFNLPYITDDGRKTTVEGAFQAGKVFGDGSQIGFLPPAEAKRAARERMRAGGGLRGFRLGGRDYPLNPPTAFYDWIYTNALAQSPRLGQIVQDGGYTAFTDIMFDPKRSKNCQAEAVARFTAMSANGTLEENMRDFDSFAGGLGGSVSPAQPQPQPQPAQPPQEIVPGPVVREFSELQVSPLLKAALAETLPYRCMFEAQAEAVAKVIDGSNVVASIPTAGGKSVIGYIALFNRLLSKGEKGMYIVPFKALAEEKKEEIENLGKRLGVNVCVMTGDHKDKTSVPLETDILLATAEKAESLLRGRDRWITGVGYDRKSHSIVQRPLGAVVADEVHMIADAGRGPIYESLLTQLHSEIPTAQVVAISGTVPNPQDLAAWLDAETVVSDVRPTKLRIGVYDPRSRTPRVNYDNGSSESVAGGAANRQTALRAIAKDAVGRGESVLVFVSSKLRAEKLAEMLKENGISAAYHHAGLGNRKKAEVEADYKAGKYSVLVATPTLAAGVNLPADVAVVYDTERYDGATQSYVPLTKSEITQMLGRAGRFGREGRGILMPLMDTNELGTRTPVTPEDLERNYVYSSLDPVQSAMDKSLDMTVLGLLSRRAMNMEDLCRSLLRTYWGVTHSTGDSLRELFSKTSESLKSLFAKGLLYSDGTVMGCSVMGSAAAKLCIRPETAENLMKLVKDPEPLMRLGSEGRDVYTMAVLMQTEEMEGLSASKKAAPLWEKEFAKWKGVREMVPDISEDRFRAAIALAAVMRLRGRGENSYGKDEREEWADEHGVYFGDLMQRVGTAEWLAYSLDVLADSAHASSPYYTALESRLMDYSKWKDKNIWGLMKDMGFDMNNPENPIAAALFNRLNDAWDQLMPLERLEDDPLAEPGSLTGRLQALFPMGEQEVMPAAEDEHVLETPLGPCVRQDWPPVPNLVDDWTADAEARFLELMRKDPKTESLFSVKQLTALDKSLDATVNDVCDRVTRGGAASPHEVKLQEWWTQYGQNMPRGRDLLEWSVRRALRASAYDNALVACGEGPLEPKVFRDSARKAMEDERAESAERESNMRKYYGTVNKYREIKKKSYQLGPTKEYRIARPATSDYRNLYRADGDNPFLAGAYVVVREADVNEDGEYVPDEQDRWLDGHSTGREKYSSIARRQFANGNSAFWRTVAGMNGNSVVITVKANLPTDEKAVAVTEQMREAEKYFTGTGRDCPTVLSENPELARELSVYMKDKDVIAFGEGAPQTLPVWGGPDEDAPRVNDEHIVIDWNGNRIEDLKSMSRLKGADLAERGLSENNGRYRTYGSNVGALLKAPVTALLGVRVIPGGSPREAAVRDAILSAPGTIVCDLPKADSGLREVLMANAGRVILTVKGTTLTGEEKRFIQALAENGGAAIAVEGQAGYTPYLQAALGDRTVVAGVDNIFSSHIANAIHQQSKLSRELAFLPGTETYAHAMGVSTGNSAKYVPGTNLAAEVTLALEHLHYRPKSIAAFAEGCGMDAAAAMSYASTLDGFEEAHQAAVKRLNDMADYGIGVMTVFDPAYHREWAECGGDSMASVAVLGNRSLLKAPVAAADGSDGLYDFEDDFKKLKLGDHPYTRAVGTYMQLITTRAFRDSGAVLATAARSSGAAAANEAAYRTGGKLIRYLETPIEDLMVLGGPDSALMHYLRDKRFANPDDGNRYSLRLTGDDGLLDPARIYGIERESDDGAARTYTYEEGAGVEAFMKFCSHLDRLRGEAIAKARAAKEPIPPKLVFTDGARTITLPMHPVIPYKDILMDSLALQMAKDDGNSLLIAPTEYSTDLSPGGKGWSSVWDPTDMMVASTWNMVMAGSDKNHHLERKFKGQMMVLPVYSDNRTYGGRERSNLWCGKNATISVFGDEIDKEEAEMGGAELDKAVKDGAREYSVEQWLGKHPKPAQEQVKTEVKEENAGGNPSGTPTEAAQNTEKQQ